ncbi:hypothetical protein OO184_24355, partial [Photorhabdus sp. APURE]|uniref:RHS repeat domain-containing protein n=1 Tax=Photorhabdus aballayi TaxID=2991723 RepID=UPI0024B4CA0B
PRACDEQFVYDAGQNLHYHKRVPEQLSEDLRQTYHTQQAGRVVQHGACTYRYDENGRRTEKTEQRWGHRPRTWRYRWDAHDRLTGVISPEGTRWRYCYDAFGRRISKRKETDTAGPPVKPTAIIGYDYLWSGEQLIEETPVYADGTVDYEQSIHWLYEPGALTPSARFEKGQLYYVVSDHQGTVREILTEEGELRWAGRLLTWGEPERWPVLTVNDPRNLTCNFRFCGQYEDRESGLFYNRHRYYENETGQYLSPDPLNLAGGVNPYSYVHNPANWIDPLGLLSESTFIHYTDKAGFDSIMKDGVLNPNAQGKVYMTDILMTPSDVEKNLFINNPRYAGRGEYAIVFKVDSVQLHNTKKISEFEYIHSGKLKMKDVVHAGKNPYSVVSHLDYDSRNRITNEQFKMRSKCGG